MSLTTEYDKAYTSDFESIKSYLSTRLTKILSAFDGEKFLSLGYIFEIGYDLPQDHINRIVKEHSGMKAATDNTASFSMLYARPIGTQYYLNVSCSKYIKVDIAIDPTNLEVKGQPERSEGIVVGLDLNTKFGQVNGLAFQNSFFEELPLKLFRIIENNELPNYLNGDLK